MNLQRRSRSAVITLIFMAVLVAGAITVGTLFPAFAYEETSPVIIIDAGHGGFDGGAVANDGTVEKEINLNIATGVESILKLNGFNVVMTRTTDTGTEDNSNESIAVRKKSDLKNRLKLMNEYPDAVYVSIHLNKFTTSSASGAQMFYSRSGGNSKALAECIQSSIVTSLQPENKRVIKQGTDSAYLLKYATVPAVIVECGFLSNSRELQLLKTHEYQSQLAFCIANGIMEYQKCKDEE